MDFNEIFLLLATVITIGAVMRSSYLKARVRQLEKDVVTDDLTKLLNRQGLEAELARELARARRRGEALALLVIDLDHFKKINDTYGHERGDQFLRDFASLLRRRFRQEDVVARFGGEEFVIAIQTPLVGAVAIAEEIRSATAEKLSLMLPDGSVAGTLSIGVCTFNSMEHVDGEALIAAADRLMYQAKQRRNCIIAADC